MQKNILLPQLELTMESTIVLNWLVNVGDQVSDVQPVLEVESQKGIMEVPANETGYIRKLFVKPGDTIREKALLCILTDTRDEAFYEPSTQMAEAAVAKTQEKQPPAAAIDQEIPGGLKAAPAARRMAKELGIDLTAVQGTGPGGRITVEDVGKAKAGMNPETA